MSRDSLPDDPFVPKKERNKTSDIRVGLETKKRFTREFCSYDDTQDVALRRLMDYAQACHCQKLWRLTR
jgi:hypothetical protein